MKKIISCLVAFLLCVSCVSVVGCGSAQDKLEISDTTLSMSLFDEKTITVDTNIEGTIQWTSSNEQAVIVSGSAKSVTVTAIGAGTSTVTAAVGEKSISCTITVAQTSDTLVLDVTSARNVIAVIGNTSQIAASVSFKGNAFTKADVSYVVNASPAGCITVSDSGLISAVSAGSATVNVKASYHGHYSNEINVSVIAIPDVSVQLNKSEVYLVVGDANYPSTAEITAKYVVDGVETAATVSASEVSVPAVASFTDNVITALSVGVTDITLTFEYQTGVTFDKVITVNVSEAPDVQVNLNKATATINNRSVLGNADEVVYSNVDELSATVTVNDVNQVDPEIAWSVTSGEGVATVDEDGVVTGLVKGVATVTATYTDVFGVTHTADCTVTVDGPVYYGEHSRFADINGVVARVDGTVSLVYEGLDLATSTTDSFIRFQYIPPVEYTGSTDALDAPAMGPYMIYVTLQDSVDLSNYITIAIRRYKSDYYYMQGSEVGVRASCWSQDTFFTGLTSYDSFYGRFGNAPDDPTSWGCPMGSDGGYASGASFSFYGYYLDEADPVKYMLGISINETSLYMQNNGKSALLWDLDADSTAVGKTAWTGFTSNKVNVFVRTDFNEGGAGRDFAYFVIDTFGGRATTANDVSGFTYARSLNQLVPEPYRAAD